MLILFVIITSYQITAGKRFIIALFCTMESIKLDMLT